MVLPLLGALALGAGGAALASRMKGGGSKGINTTYSGARPPEVSFLRPVEKQITDILMRRSLGQDVGFDPERRRLLEENLRSRVGKQTEDSVRDAQGLAGRAGLSGNLRAQEALEGRVRRDADRTLTEGLTDISIEDLTRANQERDINTGRLQNLNTFNFDQQNRVADFDLRRFGLESGLQLGQQKRDDAYTSDLLKTAIGGASLFLPQPAGSIVSATAPTAIDALTRRTSGTGVSPYGPFASINNVGSFNPLANRNYARRVLTGK